MIKYLILSILLWSQVALSASNLTLQFSAQTVKQGSLETARVSLDADTVQKLPLQKLKGQTLADTIYLYDVSPLMRKEGSQNFEAEAKVIFVKVPETNALGTKIGTEDVLITWGNTLVAPTEPGKGFIFGNFSIPSRPQILLWLSIIVGLVVLTLGGLWGKKKYQTKQALKAKQKAFKQELLAATNYSEVVGVWKKKHSFVTAFPQIEDPFKDFETVLFKYQFKPRQSEAEMNVVMDAYREFVRKIEGGLNGI